MVEPKNKPLQIYLRQDQLSALRRVAEQRGASLAELIRLGVDLFLDNLPAEQDPLLDVVGLYDSGITDLAQNHDAYLLDLERGEAQP